MTLRRARPSIADTGSGARRAPTGRLRRAPMYRGAQRYPALEEPREPAALALFLRGFAALLPLWAGAIPVGIAYGVAARAAGLSSGETQLMSVAVFSAAAQVSAVPLLEAGAPAPVFVATAAALNAQLLLVSLAAGGQLRLSWVERLVAACFLTDGAYGVAAASGRITLPGLLGTGLSMFLAWNVGTALGVAAGSALPDPR